MSQYENKVKVQILDGEDISLALIKPIMVLGKKVNFDDHNKALLELLLTQGGKEIIAYLTDEGRLAVDGGGYGFDGYIMIGFEFVNKENIRPLNVNFHIGKMYRMQDKDDVKGFFVGFDFDVETKTILYSIMNPDRGLVKGREMVELDDETLEMFGLGDRFDYYTSKEV